MAATTLLEFAKECKEKAIAELLGYSADDSLDEPKEGMERQWIYWTKECIRLDLMIKKIEAGENWDRHSHQGMW